LDGHSSACLKRHASERKDVPATAAFVGNYAPHIGERAATRGRSAMGGGDERGGVKAGIVRSRSCPRTESNYGSLDPKRICTKLMQFCPFEPLGCESL